VKDEEGTVKAECVCTLTSKISAKAFISLVQEHHAIVTDEDDPNMIRNVLVPMKYYTKMLKEKKMKTTQTLLPSFFMKMKSIKPPEPQYPT
jgi:hypothetical protein